MTKEQVHVNSFEALSLLCMMGLQLMSMGICLCGGLWMSVRHVQLRVGLVHVHISFPEERIIAFIRFPNF